MLARAPYPQIARYRCVEAGNIVARPSHVVVYGHRAVLSSCTVPAAGKPTFELADDEMEMGVGIHGEPGRRRVKLMGADAIADEMVAAIVSDFGADAGGPALLFVNGFGGTPAMELYLMYNAARSRLEKAGFRVERSLVGSYVTSLEMAGCSLTVTRLTDEIARGWDAPVHTPSLRWGL
ncbi:hypothetical protein SD80_012835 [Scytonema tolypothrichoides VB-61278]|nr:hypothetical protein SD80_012835 [Scytonema tolypothrichoides VB-61278]